MHPSWLKLFTFVLGLLVAMAPFRPALAIDVMSIGPDQVRIDLTSHAERYAGRGDRLQIETAPGPDGVAGRVEVKAQNAGTNPGWMVFALRNSGDRAIERWLVAERFTFIGSGIVYPDLDASRITAVTPSQGFVPERIASDRADIFQVTIEPGQTVTFVAEMASERFPTVNLWKPFFYEAKQRERTLLNGILLGITGLLAVFLTALFAANHKAVFPTTGLLAWSVLALLCVDFRFWHRVFRLSAEDNSLYRAAAEAAVAASLVIFLYSFLKLARWHSWIKLFWMAWIGGQLFLVAMAPLDPGLAATLARSSFVVIAGFGSLFILYLILANQDRAFALLPSWLLLLVWIFAAAMAASGKLNGEFIAAGLICGLVLVLLLISLTVTQFAFRSGEAAMTAPQDAALMRNYAIEGAGAATWEWSSRRNEIATGSIIEEVLGLQRGELTCGLEDWLKHLRLGDRERLRSQIEAMLQKGAGQIQADFQMRSGDGTFRWFALRGATLPQSDQRSLRCVGLLREITREMRAHERLIIDAVRDNLTGLPNRELFMDRLTVNLQRARQDGIPSKAALLLVEIDRFDKILDEFGSIRADSMFLTVSKRLVRSVAPQDTLARMSNDQFAILVANGGDQREVAMFAEHVRRSIRSPMKFAGREIILTGSIGIAGVQDDQVEPEQLLRDADTALFRAKRSGVDRVEVFRPNMRTETDDRTVDVDLLRKAMERKQIFALYQPIYSLSPERLAGFECVLRWEHPQRGAMGPSEFMRIADRGGLAAQLALQVLEKAATDAAGWQKAVPRTENTLFLSINVGDKLPLQPEFVQEVRTLLGRHNLPRGSLRFEISDSALRENPERGTEVLGWLRNAGAGAILSDFGAGQLPLGDLSRLAIDGIRLDRWLCFDALGEGPGVALVRGIAALARELGRPVIADSVESTEDVAVLRAAGCTLALGPLYGDPLSERQMDELLSVVRKAELRNERRGLLGGGLLSRNKRPTATAGRNTKVSEAAAGAARAGRKKVAASTLPVGQNGFNGSTFEADDEEALPFARTNGEMVDYDEAVSAAMIASAQDAARHFEQSQSAIPPAGHISDSSLRVASPTGLPLAAPPSMAIDGGGNGQPATNGLLSPNGASPPSDATGVIASQLANAFASMVPQADPQAPLQLAAASDTPTLLLSPRAGAAKPLPSVPAREMLSGLARLQRGAFGVRTNGAAAATSENKGSDTSDPANPPVGLADTMPDNDVLRGLAQRLEAALRRERR